MKRIFSILLILILLGGCTTADYNNSDDQDKPKTIAVLLKAIVNPYWQEMRSGMQDAADDLGVELVLLYPESETDVEQQNMIFRDLIAQKPDAIICAPCDSMMGPQMETLAKQADIKLFAVDTAAENTDVPYIGVDNEKVGAMAAEHLAKTLNYSGQVAVFTGSQIQSPHFYRANSFLKTIRQYPGIDIVAMRYTASDFEHGMAETKTVLNLYPDLDGIFCTSAVMSLGVVEQVKAMFRQNYVQIVTVDTQPDALAAVSSGQISGLITQDGYANGYQAIKTAVDGLSGKKVEQNTYLPVELLTRKNVDEFTEKYLQRRDTHD